MFYQKVFQFAYYSAISVYFSLSSFSIACIIVAFLCLFLFLKNYKYHVYLLILDQRKFRKKTKYDFYEKQGRQKYIAYDSFGRTFKRKIVCAFEITQISSLYNFQWILQSKVLVKSIKEVRGM